MAKRRGKRWVANGYDRSLGRKIHLGTFDSRREALDAESNHRLKAKPSSRETCADFAARWPNDYPRPRLSTRLGYAERLRPFVDSFGSKRLSEVTRPMARAWALTHKQYISVVRAMYADALADGLVAENPFTNLRIGTGQGRKNITALTEDELHHLADTAHHPKMKLGDFAPVYRAMVLFSGYTGVRPGELFALKAEDVEGDFAKVSRSRSAKDKSVGPTKTGRSRTIIIPPVARDALRAVPTNPSGWLFCTPTDQPWLQANHHRYWKRLRKLAGFPDLEHYELRHCAATTLLERGVTPWDVANQLGHTDGGRLVMELYGHPSEAGARSRLLAAWDSAPASGANREQVVQDGPQELRLHP